MAREDLQNLAGEIETADRIDTALAAKLTVALRSCFPDGPVADGAPATDALLALVQSALPGWHYRIHGRARPAGDWSCTLRRSDVLDDDEIVGTGKADTLPQALAAALLRVASWL